MVFSSIIFLFYFLPLFFLAYLLTRFSKTTLLAFSLIFYAWGEPIFIPLMIVMIILNHRFGLAIARAPDAGRARFLLIGGIATNLLPLVVFKYGTFLLHILINTFAGLAIRKFGFSPDQALVNHIPLPLGISFYTFHALSYLIDVYRKDVRAERSLRDLAVYISMFPQFVAGQIIRYKTIAGEIHKPVLSLDRAAEGVRIFVMGLCPKTLMHTNAALRP